MTEDNFVKQRQITLKLPTPLFDAIARQTKNKQGFILALVEKDIIRRDKNYKGEMKAYYEKLIKDGNNKYQKAISRLEGK